MKIVILLAVLAFLNLPAHSQSWQFAKKLSGAASEYSSGITIDQDGNSYIIGSFKGTITLDTISIAGSNTQHVFVAKYNPTGNIIWAKTIALAVDSLLDVVNLNAITQDSSGSIYITGNYLGSAIFFGTKHTSVASSEIYISKLSTNGDFMWLRTGGGYGVGNYNQNEAYAICTDGIGNCLVTGRYFNTATFDTITISASLPNELFVAKYNSAGNIVWVKSGGGDFGIHNGFGIASDPENNVYVTGDFFGHLTIDSNYLDAVDAEQKIFIAKFSSSGRTLWAKEVGSGGYYGIGAGITVDKNGNSYIAGFFRSTINFGSTQLTFNRNVIAYAMLAVKYDHAGQFLWAIKSDGAEQNTLGDAIYGDQQGNSYLTGSFTNTASFGLNTLTKDTGIATFVTKVDSGGNFLWAKQTGGGGSNNGNGIALNKKGDLVVVGGFSDTITFDSKILTSSGGSNIFIAELTHPAQKVQDPLTKIIAPVFYPNPADQTLHFFKSPKVALVDILGRIVLQCNDCSELDVINIPTGTYFSNGNLIVIQH